MGAHSPDPRRTATRETADSRSTGLRPRDVCALTDRPTGAHADGWRMLHPLGLLVALVDSVRSMVSLAVSMIVVARIVVRSHAWSLPAIVVFAVAVALARPIAQWASTRYRLGPDALAFRSGVFFRKDRTISYGSIHAINSSSPIYLQPFGVVRLTVAAAGSGSTDITLDAVPAALQLELERLRTAACARTRDDGDAAASRNTNESGSGAVFSAVAGPISNAGVPSVPTGSTATPMHTPTPTATVPNVSPDGAPTATSMPSSRRTPSAISSPAVPPQTALPSGYGDAPVFRASTRDILLFAVTDLGFLAAAVVVYGFVQNVQDVLPRGWMRAAERSVGDYAASGVAAVAMLVLACVIVLMMVSIVTSLLRFHGFEVWRRGDDLVVVRGLFTRRTTTIPVSRIQTIVVRQSLLRRPFHLCSVGLGLSASADGGENEENAVSASQVLPVIGTRRVAAALHAMLPEWNTANPTDGRPVDRTHTDGFRTDDHRIDGSRTGSADSHHTDSSHATSANSPHADVSRIRRTGTGLTRYYMTMPIIATVVATAAVGVGMSLVADGRFRWLMAVPLAVGAWWTACRWLASRAEGYTIIPTDRDDSTIPAADAADITLTDDIITDATHGGFAHTETTYNGGTTHGNAVRDSTASTNTSVLASPLPHRIVVTGAQRLTTFTMTTRRARVQSITRSTTPWREPRGVESVQMSLFVMNGLSDIRFRFLHRRDADALEAWFTGR